MKLLSKIKYCFFIVLAQWLYPVTTFSQDGIKGNNVDSAKTSFKKLKSDYTFLQRSSKIPFKIIGLIPDGDSIFFYTSGKLGSYSNKDYAIITQADKGDLGIVRSLYVFIQKNKSEYLQLCTNSTLVRCPDCGGKTSEPFLELSIKKRMLVFSQMVKATPETITYKYYLNYNKQKNTLQLKKLQTDSYNYFSGKEEVKYEYQKKLAIVDYCTLESEQFED